MNDKPLLRLVSERRSMCEWRTCGDVQVANLQFPLEYNVIFLGNFVTLSAMRSGLLPACLYGSTLMSSSIVVLQPPTLLASDGFGHWWLCDDGDDVVCYCYLIWNIFVIESVLGGDNDYLRAWLFYVYWRCDASLLKPPPYNHWKNMCL